MTETSSARSVHSQSSSSPTVAEVGEHRMIDSVAVPARHESTILGPGDDAAIVRACGEGAVITTDILVEGEHFRRDWSEPYEIGRRAIAQNAADIEAMGARPTGFVVAVATPRHTPAHDVAEMGRGAADEAHRAGADVVGGDLSASHTTVICVSATGEFPEGGQPVCQDGVQMNDIIAIAGNLGWSAAGLAILSGDFGNDSEFLSHPLVQKATALYRCPEPPYGEGVRVASAGAHALTDISDGLLHELDRLAHRSCDREQTLPLEQWHMRVRHGQLRRSFGTLLYPLAEECARQPGITAKPHDLVMQWVLYGGEDHALLATFAPEGDIPASFSPIGCVEKVEQGRDNATAASSAPLLSVKGHPVSAQGGWESFASPTAPSSPTS